MFFSEYQTYEKIIQIDVLKQRRDFKLFRYMASQWDDQMIEKTKLGHH